MRHARFGLQIGCDPSDLFLDLLIDIGQLPLDPKNVRMPRPVFCLQFRGRAAQLGSLSPKCLDHVGIHGLADVLSGGAGRHLLLGRAQSRIVFGLIGLSRRQFVVEA